MKKLVSLFDRSKYALGFDSETTITIFNVFIHCQKTENKVDIKITVLHQVPFKYFLNHSGLVFSNSCSASVFLKGVFTFYAKMTFNVTAPSTGKIQ